MDNQHRYDYIGEINFQFNESPKWRQKRNEATTTSELLSDIVDLYKRYHSEGLPLSTKQFCETTFVKLMTVEFVLNLNVAESVGTQTEVGT